MKQKQKIVPIQFQTKMVDDVELFVESGLYMSKAEFVRDAVRDKLIELKKARAEAALQKLRSKMKTKLDSPFVPPEVREAVFQEYAKKKGLNLTSSEKTLKLPELLKVLKPLRAQGKKIVFTNGCFDLLHVGHIRYLRDAKKQGDILIIGLNSDSSVKKLKGPKRPLIPEAERAEILAALEPVDFVTIFSEDIPLKLVEAIKPDVYVKGGDYSEEQVPEVKLVKSYGGKVYFSPEVKGKSTSELIAKLR